ncbi:MAG: 50S ribosomal protein L30 [Mucinivorans sp.]
MGILKITQHKSRIGATKTQKANLDALGLKRNYHTVEHNMCPEIVGMVEKVKHLVKVEEVK